MRVALVLAAAALGGAVLWLLRTAHPLLDLRILGIETYRVTALGGTVFRAVITAIPFLLALFFQLGFGWSAAQAGLVVVALFVGNVAIKPTTTPLMRRFGTLNATLQELGAGVGVAVGALLVRLGEPVGHALGLGTGADQPFRVAFVLLALLLAVPFVEGVLMDRAAGDAATGRA